MCVIHVTMLDIDKVEATEDLRETGYDRAVSSGVIIKFKQRCSH